MTRVLHLTGSAVDTFHADLSLVYARDALAATAGPDHEPVLAHVSPGGGWSFPTSLDAADLAAAEPVAVGPALARLAGLGVEAVVPQMFCRPGMTAYRSLLEDVLGVPLLGNPADVMALAADKARARAVVAAAGVAVPAGEVVRPGGRATLAVPAVVKPVDSDNSLGLTLVRDPAAYPDALAAAWAHGSAALVETYVELGREVRCGILERDGELVGLPLEEYAVSATKPVRDRADKLAPADGGADGADGAEGGGGGGGLRLVAKDATYAWLVDADDPATQPVQAAARAAYLAMGCRDYGLFDFRLDPEGRPWFLEAGPYCSFARSSVVAVMAAATGTDVPALFSSVLSAALSRKQVP